VLGRRRQDRDYGAPPAGSPDSQEPSGTVLQPALRPLFSDRQYQYSYRPGLVGHSPGPAKPAGPLQSPRLGAPAEGEPYCNSLKQRVGHPPAEGLHDMPRRRAGGGRGSTAPVAGRPAADELRPGDRGNRARTAATPRPFGLSAPP